jgi:hypothetical protein
MIEMAYNTKYYTTVHKTGLFVYVQNQKLFI